MAFQQVPDTVEIGVFGRMQSINMQNTYHAHKSGGYSQADIDLLAAAIDDQVTTSFIPRWSDNLTYVGVEVRGLDAETDFTSFDGSGTGPGAVSGTPLPNSVSYTVKKLSGLTGRSARGRVYIFGLSVATLDTNENFISSTFAAHFTTSVEAVRDRIDAEGWTPVIVSRFNAGVKRSVGVNFEWVSTAAGSNRLDSRRDRMPNE